MAPIFGGDPLNLGQQNFATHTTTLFADTSTQTEIDPQGPYWDGSSPVCFIGLPLNYWNQRPVHVQTTVDGVVGRGFWGGNGLIGLGDGYYPAQGGNTGVAGFGGVYITGFGDDWSASTQGGNGVAGVGGQGYLDVPAGAGVQGFGGAGDGDPGVGVWGQGGVDATWAPDKVPGTGVVGSSSGYADSPYPFQMGNGVAGIGLTGVYGFGGTGVVGATREPSGVGVLGANWTYQYDSPEAVGVKGIVVGGKGVAGQVFYTGGKVDASSVAIYGDVHNAPPGGTHFPQGPYAGYFNGPAVVNGDLTVTNGNVTFDNVTFIVVGGTKSVAVPFADGSHRLLYCMESPECWFEDFGEAKLVKGKAQIKLPRDFAAVIKSDLYHVFLTPYGHSNGLCVSKRTRQGFVVEEQGHGKSSLSFAFRIVGKRKDLKAERFAKVPVSKSKGRKPPKLPAPPNLKESKFKVELPTKPSIPSGALSADSAKTRRGG